MNFPKPFLEGAYFSTRRIETPEELRAVYGLRYQVYCNERAFLPAADYPERLEYDHFDHDAIHFAVFDQDGQVAAAARLVTHCVDRGFPHQKYCELFDHIATPDHAVTGEISRLVLNKGYRSPPGGGWVGSVVLGLYREIYLFSKENGIDYWYAAMERPLVRLLGRYGVAFDQIGPVTDYHGPVGTYLADLPALEVRLANESPALHQWFSSSNC